MIIYIESKSNTSNKKIIDNIKVNVKLCCETRDCLLKGDLISLEKL